MNEYTYISIEELIRRIKERCNLNPLIPKLNGDAVIQFGKEGKLLHIWLHGICNDMSHRVEYALESRNGEYYLKHYVWHDGKGWTFVGELCQNSLKRFRPNKI